MKNKQSIDQCLWEYTPKELIQFHANLNALFLCCKEDFHLLPLLLQVQFHIAGRKDSLCKRYLRKVNEMLNVPNEYKYSNSDLYP